MNRLGELVASGEIDASKPVSEQPGGIPQKAIAELIDNDQKVSRDYTTFDKKSSAKNTINEVACLSLSAISSARSKSFLSRFFLIENSSNKLEDQIFFGFLALFVWR